ncbi:hypothetical protein [Jannaschia ovalis]|uniref:ABC transporter substrate-binding protein n=1 Tax=Jannaschia ovalis TaxID=3038773 RepID=A0ABY8LFJ1_9RHOB|nr:hypothetical protein [Jannaschia sp. GRR-S6-38]WGH79110.1 hypothetical protein P8627_02275 [Jannaschia sp. GRR-S6-38]
MARYLAWAALAVGIAGSPAWAQAPICGGISLVGEWVGGSEAASDLATAEAPFDLTGRVPIAGHLVRMFTLSERAEIRIEVAAEPAGDPYVTVFDSAGAEVGGDDDSGGDFAARAEMALAPGTYCLAARSYESGVTDVAIRVGRTEMAAMTNGGGAASALPSEPATGGCGTPDLARLGDGLDRAGLEGGLSATATQGETPAWGLGLAEATALSITAISETGDPILTVRDADGELLAENDDFDGLNSRVDLERPVGPGEICLEIGDLNGSDNPITVTVSAFDPAAARRQRLDDAEIAPTPSDDVAIGELGALETVLLSDVTAGARASWFAFDLPAGGLILTEALGGGLDPAVTLFDRAGRRIGFNDDAQDGLDSQLVSRLPAGRYILALRLVGEGEGPVRLVMERFVPAQ